jgi:hypothetical protein
MRAVAKKMREEKMTNIKRDREQKISHSNSIRPLRTNNSTWKM